MGYFKRYASRSVESTPPAPGAPTEQTITVDQGYVPSLGFSQPDQQLSLGLALLLDRVSIDGYVGERILAAGGSPEEAFRQAKKASDGWHLAFTGGPMFAGGETAGLKGYRLKISPGIAGFVLVLCILLEKQTLC